MLPGPQSTKNRLSNRIPVRNPEHPLSPQMPLKPLFGDCPEMNFCSGHLSFPTLSIAVVSPDQDSHYSPAFHIFCRASGIFQQAKFPQQARPFSESLSLCLNSIPILPWGRSFSWNPACIFYRDLAAWFMMLGSLLLCLWRPPTHAVTSRTVI